MMARYFAVGGRKHCGQLDSFVDWWVRSKRVLKKHALKSPHIAYKLISFSHRVVPEMAVAYRSHNTALEQFLTLPTR